MLLPFSFTEPEGRMAREERREGWRGEGRRGNGDRSIRAKTTGLLSESTPESSARFSIITASKRGKENRLGVKAG